MSSRSSTARLLIAAFAFLALIGFTAAELRAQTAPGTGRIVGRVIAENTGTGLSGALLRVTPSGLTVLSGVEGRFVIDPVPAGTVSVTVENLGYGTKTVTDIVVPGDGAVELNVGLAEAAVEVEGISVSAAAERGSVTRALDEQRTATSIVSSITAEQISRSPDGNAAAAMQRVSGVTVQDGRFVFIRGTGDRYTTTSLNGARIPSPEPEKKTVPLDMFPSGLLEAITTSKTFTPDLPGDFAGGQVNLKTREFVTEPFVSLSLGSGFNTRATGQTIVAAPAVGSEWLGFGGSERQIPGLVQQAGIFDPPPPRSELNRVIESFRNVWSPESGTGAPNASAALSLGGTGPILGREISYLASFSYSRSQEVRAEQLRAHAQPTAGGGTREINRFEGSTGAISVLWGGLAQLSTLLGTNTRLVLNTTYNRTADNEARIESGFSEQFAVPLDITRLRFVERNIHSSQLEGQHELGGGHRASWSVALSGVERKEPDRSEFISFVPQDPVTGEAMPPEWFSSSNEGAVRTFGDLSENALEAQLAYRIPIGGDGATNALEMGGLFRNTTRDASNIAYGLSGSLPTVDDRRLDPEQIFDGRFTEGSEDYLRITALFQGGSYDAEDQLGAGYGMLNWSFSDRLRLIAGARYERSRVRVAATPTLGNPVVVDTVYNDILPAASLIFRLNETMNLRLSGSQTLARPEYRELANVTYRDVLGGENVLGNADLVRTLIRNADVRWEWYPGAGEAIAVAVFAKDFSNPIERVYLATSSSALIRAFTNAEGASNYGTELEVRKRLGTLAAALESFSVFANATFMKSDIRLAEDGPYSFTNSERAMVGQAPWVLNTGLTYATGSGATSATLLYNVVGRRVVAAAESPLPDVYEEPRHILDMSLRFGVTPRISAKIDAKNLLDEPFQQLQGSVTREFYRSGRVISAGLSWKQ